MANKQITGGELALKDVFSKGYSFEIPSYQRPYAWTTEEAGILFDDLYGFFISEPKDIYFLGSIVLIKEHTETKAEVVDGQQRLTTLTILFSAISSLFRATEKKDQVRKYIREPGNVIEGLEPLPRLKLRERDNDFFEKYIQGDDFDKLSTTDPKPEAQKRIKENCAEILKKLKAKFSSGDDELLKFTSFLVNRCYMVVVATPSQQSAFRVFSVMNSRGLDLLPCDIIKANIIGEIRDEQKRQKYTEKWEKLEPTKALYFLYEVK